VKRANELEFCCKSFREVICDKHNFCDRHELVKSLCQFVTNCKLCAKRANEHKYWDKPFREVIRMKHYFRDSMNFWNVHAGPWRIENCARNVRMNSSIATKGFVMWFARNTISVISTNLSKVCDCLWRIKNWAQNVQMKTSFATKVFVKSFKTSITFVESMDFRNVRASTWRVENCARNVGMDSSFATKVFVKWFATNTFFVIGTNLLIVCDCS
jgi:hypothetical protein